MDEDAAPKKRLVGRPRKRRDPAEGPVMALWSTDVITNKEPGWHYEFPLESQVRERLHPTRLSLIDFATGKQEVHDIPAWEIVKRDTGPEELAGWRPDEGKPVDSVLRHGPHVAMRIRDKYFALLERKKEQRADMYETRLNGGHSESYDLNGEQTRMAPGQRPAVKLKEQPLQRI